MYMWGKGALGNNNGLGHTSYNNAPRVLHFSAIHYDSNL